MIKIVKIGENVKLKIVKQKRIKKLKLQLMKPQNIFKSV